LGFRDLFRRVPAARTESHVEFLGEQDGPPERVLKADLAADFAAVGDVRRGYLARVGYQPNARPGVALCLRLDSGDEAVVAERVGRLFAATFARGVALDILFLSAEQEADLARVCRPFYPPAV
jgi:hypothetical protein